MAFKLDFGAPAADDGNENSSTPAFNHDEHMKKMESGIQEAIMMIESGETEQVLPILKSLLNEEETEETAEGVAENPLAEKQESMKMDFKNKIAKSLQQ